jgi:hypothetical protein
LRLLARLVARLLERLSTQPTVLALARPRMTSLTLPDLCELVQF